VHLFAAHLWHDRGSEAIVGFAVLVVFRSLTGTRGLLEDVVVDEAARNHGVGTRLVEAVVAAARAAGCRTLDLTSRPSRQAANRLYERCGFVQRTTNVWRHDLS
jgi:ribosomal protein S18 acetylase RimI-like enzyme